MRRTDSCMNCRDSREIVAHGLCAKCYMRHKRSEEASDDPFGIFGGRSERRYIAERNKMLVNLTRIIKLVDETPCLSHEDTTTIKVTIQPYLLERANALAPKKSQPELTVNSKCELTDNSADQPVATRLQEEAKLTVNNNSELIANSELDAETDPGPPSPTRPRPRQKVAMTGREAASTPCPQFAYHGGKGRLAKRIAMEFPTSGKRYIEPFAGRGNVYFAVAQLLKFEQFWLNDGGDAFLFLNGLLHSRLYAIPPRNGKEAYERMKQRWGGYTLPVGRFSGRRLPPSGLLAPYLCYSGGIYRNGSRGIDEDKAVSREGFEQSVRLARGIMERTKPRLTRLDYHDVLKECGEGDFLYLDPPYINNGVKCYTGVDAPVEEFDHAGLVELLLKAKFKWVLSEREHEVYRPLGEPVQRITVQKLLGPQGASDASDTECLWRNF